jgi:hypothetical protein
MPPVGIIEERVLCPLCSREVSKGYLWYHKKSFCPMRPGRQEELKVLAMGTPVPPQKAAGVSATGSSPPIQNDVHLSSNIISINLTEEYKNMVKVMKKKKEEEEVEEEFQCGGCNALFKAAKAPKHCPECGVEF